MCLRAGVCRACMLPCCVPVSCRGLCLCRVLWGLFLCHPYRFKPSSCMYDAVADGGVRQRVRLRPLLEEERHLQARHRLADGPRVRQRLRPHPRDGLHAQVDAGPVPLCTEREPFPFPQPLLPPPPANPPIPSISLSDSVLVRFSFVFSTSLSQSYAGMFVFFVCCFDALFFSHDVTLHSLTPLSLNIHDLSPSSTMEVRESGGRRVSGCGDNPSPALNRKNISQIECSLSRANPLRPCTVDLNATRGEDGDLHTGTLTGAPRYAPRASCRCTWLRRPTRLRACFGRPKACLPKRAPSGLGALVVENDEGGCGRSAP